MNCFAYSSIIYEEYLALIIGEISYKNKKYILFLLTIWKWKPLFIYHIAHRICWRTFFCIHCFSTIINI